jgi:hypothetical protein
MARRDTTSTRQVTASPSHLRNAALEYARRGWKLIPIKPGTKAPHGALTPNGLSDATSDPKIIEAWFERVPNLDAIAVAARLSGLLLFDVDSLEGHGKDGHATLRKLEAKLGDLPATRRVITPTGGEHLYIVAPGVTLPGTLGEGIDVKDNGYVLLPPSLHPNGHPYIIDAGGTDDVAELPQAWIAAFAQRENAEQTAVATGTLATLPAHQTLARAAASMASKGLPVEVIATAVGASAKAFNSESTRTRKINKREVRAIATSAIARFGGKTTPEVPSEKHASALSIVCLDTVQPESVEWLWRSRIPLGKVSLLVGDPGSGKSFASLAIAAAVTTGAALPDSDAAEPANVVAYNAEDGLEDTVRPRAALCGVALSRFHAIEGMRDADGRRTPFGLSDVHHLAGFMEKLGDVRLVIVDPIASLLGGVDSHRDTEVRASLQVLVELAKQTHAAVLVIMHLRKSAAERALYRVGGSIGFTGLARSVLLAGVDPADGRRAIVPIKQNLAAPVHPVEYRLDAEGRFWWGQTVPELSADRLLAAPTSGRANSVDQASSFLEDCLGDGERAADEVARLAAVAKISDATLRRAKKALKIKTRREGFGEEGRWYWSLPIDAHKSAIGAQEHNLSANGDSVSSYAIKRGDLSDHGKLCSDCKSIDLGYQQNDGTYLCRTCLELTA